MRNVGANGNKNALAEIYLYQTWARPNLINAVFTTVTDPVTGAISNTTTPATSFYGSLEAMTADLHTAYALAADLSNDDGTSGIKAVAAVGDAFMRAVAGNLATRNMYAPDAKTDGLIDLWFDDGTHASKYGSYLSALTLFGTTTGLDPQSLGYNEIAARDLGINQRDAYLLQQVAAEQLGFAKIPEPGSLWLAALALGLVGYMRRQR